MSNTERTALRKKKEKKMRYEFFKKEMSMLRLLRRELMSLNSLIEHKQNTKKIEKTYNKISFYKSNLSMNYFFLIFS